MAHHYLDDDPKFILDWQNVMYIRHPKKLITSFSKVINNPSLADIGIKKSSEMFEYLKKNGKNPVVIDSDELLKNPEAYLKNLCDLLIFHLQKKCCLGRREVFQKMEFGQNIGIRMSINPMDSPCRKVVMARFRSIYNRYWKRPCLIITC